MTGNGTPLDPVAAGVSANFATSQPPYANCEVAKLRRLDVEHMLTTTPPPVPWVVEGFAARGMTTMLAGREGRGKSMLALALGSAVGHGSTLAGYACETGRVLVVDAENGPTEAHRRVRGLSVKPGTLGYYEAIGFDLKRDLADLDRVVRAVKPDLLVLDSLRALWPGGDENDSREVELAVRPLVNRVREWDTATVLLHHAGKGGDGYRGSTALGASVELGFTLVRHDGDPERRARREVSCWKCRPAPEPASRWVSLTADGGLVAIGEAESWTGPGAVVRDDLAERIMETLSGGGLRRQEIARALGVATDDGSFKRALEALVASGALQQPAYGKYAAVGTWSLGQPPRPSGQVTKFPEGNGRDQELAERIRSEAQTVRCSCQDGGIHGAGGRCGRCYGRRAA